MAMARRSQFEGRLLAILDSGVPRSTLSGFGSAVILLGTLAAVIPAAALRPMEPAPVAAVSIPAAPEPRVPEAEPVRLSASSSALVKKLEQGRVADSTLRAVIASAAKITSDGDRSHVLLAVLRAKNLDQVDLVSLLGAAGSMTSDGSKAVVLRPAALRVRFDDPAARAAFFAATSTVASAGSRAAVLRQLIDAQLLPPRSPAWADFLACVRSMNSDGDQAVLLRGVFEHAGPLDSPLLIQILNTARSMNSDGDKASVLRSAAKHQQLDDAARAAFLDAATSISSDADRASALTALLPPESQGDDSATAAAGGWDADISRTHTHEGRVATLVLKAKGVHLDPTHRRVVSMDSGGFLSVDETLLPDSVGKPATRSLRLTQAEDGSFARRYRVNDESQAWNDDAREWLARILRENAPSR
jgi:hypothetical protein